MADPSYEELRLVAVDQTNDETPRLDAIRGLAALNTREAVAVLLEISAQGDEAEPILREAGFGLASLRANGVDVTEWDLRDMTGLAADAFFG